MLRRALLVELVPVNASIAMRWQQGGGQYDLATPFQADLGRISYTLVLAFPLCDSADLTFRCDRVWVGAAS